jgi:hypothetical protein
MGNRFASGKNAIAECDRCGQRYKLTQLRTEIIKTKNYNLLVCYECWDPDHPQLQLGMYPVDDPQGLRNPRPDRSYITSGLASDGTLSEGSRIFQWGWNPVGGSQQFAAALTPNNLVLQVELNPTPVPAAILDAVVGFQPQETQFKTTKINGRSLAAIVNAASVGTADRNAYLAWINGTLTNASQIAYIEQVMNPYMLANPVTYAQYMTIV